MQFKAGFYANRMYTVCHTVAYSSSRNIYCHVLSELLKFLSLFAEIVTLLLILILLMNGQMVMEKIKSKGYPKGFVAKIDSPKVQMWRKTPFEFHFHRLQFLRVLWNSLDEFILNSSFQFGKAPWNSLDELNGRKSFRSFLCQSGKIEDEVCGGGKNWRREKELFSSMTCYTTGLREGYGGTNISRSFHNLSINIQKTKGGNYLNLVFYYAFIIVQKILSKFFMWMFLFSWSS